MPPFQSESSLVLGVFPVTISPISPKVISAQLPASRNTGKRSRGTNADFLFFFSPIALASLLLIRTQPRNLAPLRLLVQQRRQLVHQRQFGLGARLPAQSQRGHEFAQGFAVEDAAA